MALQQQTAFVLHRRPYQDNSLLLDLFTQEQGRVAAVAKHAFTGKSPKAHKLQAFTPLCLSLSGRTSLQNLRQVDVLAPAFKLSGDALYYSLYINELSYRLVPEGIPEPELFRAYQSCIKQLSLEANSLHLRQFEWLLLDSLGVAPDLSCCALSGMSIAPDKHYHMTPQGPIETSEQGISGEALLGMLAHQWLQPGVSQAARVVLGTLIEHQLGSRPLKSRELFLASRGRQ